MNLKNIISILTLGGALATANLAQADRFHVRVYDHRSDWNTPVQQDDDGWDTNRVAQDDVIGTARVNAGRGVAQFTVTPQMRRDGLALRTDSGNIRILAVDFEYSDGRVVRLGGRQLRPTGDGLVQIQSGRPPGLRFVRVLYASRAPRQYAPYQQPNGYGPYPQPNGSYQQNGYGQYGQWDGNGYDGTQQRPQLGTLQLVQIHTGDGYTHQGDLWQNRDPDGDGDDEVDGAQSANPGPGY